MTDRELYLVLVGVQCGLILACLAVAGGLFFYARRWNAVLPEVRRACQRVSGPTVAPEDDPEPEEFCA